MQTKKIQFTEDTPIEVRFVGKTHVGLMQHRPNDGKENPAIKGKMETYFPKGTTLEIPDFLSMPTVQDITTTTTPGQGTPALEDE